MIDLGRLSLARGTLDRVAEHRRDEAWLTATWKDPRTRVFAVDGGRALVRPGERPSLVLGGTGQALEGDRYLLGVDDGGVAYFAVAAPLPAVEGAEPGDLRAYGALLDDRDSGLITHAVALANWHATHGFCPRCGTATELAAAGHVRVCPNDGSEHFPRVDPAVIMLIRDQDDRVLLARSPQWPAAMRSVLAGFVEPGESLEQAVAREVREEVGIDVREVTYVGSQPWPLPRSLMIGFFCAADGSQELRLDPEEIQDAGWFSREELRAAVEAGEIFRPGSVSIAGRMISYWLAEDVSSAPPASP